jgi:hypothetical protein
MYYKRTMSCGFDQSYDRMSLTKIPVIILMIWGINASYTPPNPTPPKYERFATLPLETKYVEWAPMIIRVSNFVQNIL